MALALQIMRARAQRVFFDCVVTRVHSCARMSGDLRRITVMVDVVKNQDKRASPVQSMHQGSNACNPPMHTDQLTVLFSLKRLFELCAQRACTHLVAMSVRIEQRTVVTFDKKRGGTDAWIVPTDRVETVVGANFVTLGYCGDRGFAKFCEGDLSKPNPLACYKWLESLQQLRNTATSRELDKIAAERVITHVQGSHVKNPGALAEFMPPTLTISLPAFEGDDGLVEALNVRVIPESVHTNKMVAIECTTESLDYVRRAMIHSRSNVVARARPSHEQRLSALTGVKGVCRHKSGRVRCAVKDAEGKMTMKTRRLNRGASDPQQRTDGCQALKDAAAENADNGEPAQQSDEEPLSPEPLQCADAGVPAAVAASSSAVPSVDSETPITPTKIKGVDAQWAAIFKRH